MRFNSIAGSFLLPLTFQLAMASLVKRQDGGYQRCTINAIYKGVWGNPEINYDASTYCLSLLGSTAVTSCLSTATARTTVNPSVVITGTVTVTTAVPASTVTVTSTAMVFDVARRDVWASYPQITDAPHLSEAVDAFNIEKRQNPNSFTLDLTSAIASACVCNEELRPLTSNVICTNTLTISETVRERTVTTIYRTITTSGTTIVTETASGTTRIQTANMTVTSGSTWSVPAASSSTNWDEWTKNQTVTSTRTSSDTDIVTSATSSSTANISPSDCPYINNTRSISSQSCYHYQRLCYRNYAATDFYEFEASYQSAEECTTLCDAINRSGTSGCRGIVWTTTSNNGANCRVLRSTNSPLYDGSSVALLLMRDEGCNNSSNSNNSTSTTTSAATFTAQPRTIGGWDPDHGLEHTWSEWSWSYPTQTRTGTDPTTTPTNITSSCEPSTIHVSESYYMTQFATETITSTFNQTVTETQMMSYTVTSTSISAATVTETISRTATLTAPCTTTPGRWGGGHGGWRP